MEDGTAGIPDTSELVSQESIRDAYMMMITLCVRCMAMLWLFGAKRGFPLSLCYKNPSFRFHSFDESHSSW